MRPLCIHHDQILSLGVIFSIITKGKLQYFSEDARRVKLLQILPLIVVMNFCNLGMTYFLFNLISEIRVSYETGEALHSIARARQSGGDALFD